MKHFLLIFVFLSIKTFAFGQVIITEPYFPTDNDEVTVVFNASHGNGELENYSSDIWAHTGVITEKSDSPSDWKYVKTEWGENTQETKLEKISTNIYHLTISGSIREFYEVPNDEEIIKLAFVFRNSDGSKIARDTDGSDIFADVYLPGLNLKLQSPEQNIVVLLNEEIEINAVSAFSNSLNLYIDNELLATTHDFSISETITVETEGLHWIKTTAMNDTAAIADSVYFFVRNEAQVVELPIGIKDGINYINDTTVTLVLYAPEKEFVFAIGDFSDWELFITDTIDGSNEIIHSSTIMNQTPDGKRYWITLTSLEAGKEYIYQYFIDGKIKIADPYTEKTSDPWADKDIDENIYPNLIEYPSGKTTQIASIFQTAQDLYQWNITDFSPPDVDTMIIYELLIRDFTENGDYKTVMDTLNYLENLGINTLEIMPFNEFENNDSWGYNPSFYFAPDKAYGTKNDLKALIDECHKRGIAVIMDIVLNHSYGQSPLVRMYFDGSKPTENNPWYNTESPNTAFSWGYDFNHESPDTKTFIDSVTKYWIQEYKIDGYRFDFTKGFTNTPGDGSDYDQSRIDILKRMGNKIWEYKENAILILEHFAENTEEKVLANYGFLIWGNMNYNYNEATMGWHEGNKSDFSRISYKNRTWTHPHLVGYMESHDEERLMYKNIQYGNKSDDYQIQYNKWKSLERIELAATFFIPVPGPKMIWQFGEIGYDYSIDYNGRVGKKPIRWNYLNELSRLRVYQIYAALNKLKTTEEAFQSNDFSIDAGWPLKKIHINHDSMNVTILGNFDVIEGIVDPEFQSTGTWFEFFTGESLNVSDINMEITLAPGEYRLYTSKPLEQPEIISSIEMTITDSYDFELNLYPNPVSTEACICINSKTNTQAKIALYNYTGQKIKTIFSGQINHGISEFNFNIEKLELPEGMYFVRFNSNEKQIVKKIIIQ